MSDDDKKAAAPTADENKVGYKRPPVRSRFPKGTSGNPFGRRKGQRNMLSVLNEVLHQAVTIKQGNRSQRLTKGEALIKVITSKANNGDRQAIVAVSLLAEKIGRVEDRKSETSQAGVMLVPGVANSMEEWKKSMVTKVRDQEERTRRLKEDAPVLRKMVADYLEFIAKHSGTPIGDFAVVRLAELKNTDRYRTNYFLHWHLPEETVDTPKKDEPDAKLPWDADDFVRMPFYARKEYARTHSEDVKPKLPPQMAPHPCYRPIGKPGVWSKVPFSQLPLDDPRRGEMPDHVTEENARTPSEDVRPNPRPE
jgi:hypothetical protein